MPRRFARGPWRHALLLAMALLGAACGGKGDPQALKAAAVQSGDEFVAAAQFAPAAAAYRRAVDIDPNDGPLRVKLAKAHEQAGQWTPAANEAAYAAFLLPRDFEARFLASRLILGQSRFDDSLALSNALRREFPGRPDVLVVWGTASAKLISSTWALFKLSATGGLGPDYERGCMTLRPDVAPEAERAAEAALREAVAREPESTDVALALINFLWAAGRAEETAGLLQRTADRSPHGFANEVAGHFFLVRGHDALGEKYLEIAAEANAAYTRAPRLALADHYLASGRFDDALRHLNQIPESDDRSGDIAARKADAELRRGRVDEARRLIDAIIPRFPMHRRALVINAQLLLKSGNVRDAVVAARAAVAADQAFADSRVALAEALVASGDPSAALVEYAEASRIDPARPSLSLLTARLALDARQNRLAEVSARRAVDLRPEDRDAKVVLATAQLRRRDHEAAAVTLAPLLRVEPRPLDVLVQLGQIETGRGNDAAARAAFEAALGVNPTSLDAMAGLVDLDLTRGRLDEARERVTRAMAAFPNEVAALVLGSHVYRAAGDMGRTVQLLRRALDLRPDDAHVLVLLAQSLVDTECAEDARQLLERALARQPSSVAVRTALADTLRYLRRFDDARAHYWHVLTATPGEAAATAGLALLDIDQRNNLDIALSLLTAAERDVALDADNEDALGWVYMHRGMPQRALPRLEAAVRANPRHPRYQHHLGVAYARLGDTAKARAALTQATALEVRAIERTNIAAALAALPD